MNQCVQANLVNKPQEEVIGAHLTEIPGPKESYMDSPEKGTAVMNRDLGIDNNEEEYKQQDQMC